MSEEPGSITRWIDGLVAGDSAASQAVWERFHQRLLAVARTKLSGLSAEASEEDCVQNAFHSFFRRTSKGQFEDLKDRNSLWRLLVVITARKSIDQIRRSSRGHAKKNQSDSGTRSVPVSMFSQVGDHPGEDLDALLSREPDPEFAAEVAEEFQTLMNALIDPSLQRVAQMKMDGFTYDEIAAELDCSRRSVARKLESIRCIWQQKSVGEHDQQTLD
ncbi:MAG: sigma-70 family RNA polymerase sigma factor [Planctomycetota bacterium]